eukprot:2072146-Pyramimonas_sp.AAC.1
MLQTHAFSKPSGGVGFRFEETAPRVPSFLLLLHLLFFPFPPPSPFSLWRTPRTSRSAMGDSKSPCGGANMRPLTRFVAPQGAQPTAPVAVPARVPATHFGTTFTRFVLPSELHR